jgi:adenine-specific DNA-methyltransferase
MLYQTPYTPGANGVRGEKDSTRLVWDTKPRRPPNLRDIELRTAEAVIPNPHGNRETLNVRRETLMNRLIWGDNLLVARALLAQGYEGKINLIYIDPPFDSKADYFKPVTRNALRVTGLLAYRDTWAGGTDSYLDMLYPRLRLMKRLLAEDGSIYVHLDWHVGHYVKVMMDEIFGKENFINEIIWCYRTGGVPEKVGYAKKHDVLLFYSKSRNSTFFKLPKQKSYLDSKFFKPHQEKSKQLGIEEDYIGMFRWVGCRDVWDDIKAFHPRSSERIDYATQKPEELLQRVINASCPDNGIVADFFAGSGTTCAVAEKLGRRWIGCELGKVGIQVTRARLVEMKAKPFLIENIRNYQREMIYLAGGRIWEMRHLILKLYGAVPRDKTSGLGVRKAPDGVEELVYVGYPDRLVTAKKAEELAIQARKLDGRGYKRLIILGWDYECNYHQALEGRRNALKDKPEIQIESRDIPPDIHDYLRRAKSGDDIEALADRVKFHQRPYFELENPDIRDLEDGKVQIKIAIKRYVLRDIPVGYTSRKQKESCSALMKLARDDFAILIDYWATDWDYNGSTFKSQWQAFRGNGKKAETIPISATGTVEKKEKRIVAVRVVDIFGNDTAAAVEV